MCLGLLSPLAGQLPRCRAALVHAINGALRDGLRRSLNVSNEAAASSRRGIVACVPGSGMKGSANGSDGSADHLDAGF